MDEAQLAEFVENLNKQLQETGFTLTLDKAEEAAAE